MSLIIPANTLASGGYAVDNSCRFNYGSNDYLTRTPSSASNRKTWTYSFWTKKVSNARNPNFLAAGNDGTEILISQNTGDLQFYQYSGGFNAKFTTSQYFRDVSAWYHIVVAVDTTQATASNRVNIYQNGNLITDFPSGEETYPSLNFDFDINNTTAHYIGRYATGASTTRDGDYYLAEAVLIDGLALDATSFGEFDEDSGIWKPIDVSGLTFGTNGFYLDFENSGALGADVSGNTNNFTVNNLTAIDQSTDTCTNNFATLNPLVNNFGDNMTLSEGNLVATSPDSSWNAAFSTFGVTKGKWYWEAKLTNTSNNYYHGVAGSNILVANAENPMNSNGFTGFYNASGGEILKDGDVTANDYGTLSTNDILGVALNADDYQITFYKNGVALVSNYALSTTGRDTLFVLAVSAASGVSAYNFGSPPFAISSGNQDGNGYGNFEYAIPSGYYALNTKNLAEYG